MSAQMHFKYAQQGADGKELFETGVVLARQYLDEGPWEVWDLRPDREKLCQPCSSAAERIVRHDSGSCPKDVTRKALGNSRSAARRKAIADASRHRAVAVAEPPANPDVRVDAVASDSSDPEYQPMPTSRAKKHPAKPGAPRPNRHCIRGKRGQFRIVPDGARPKKRQRPQAGSKAPPTAPVKDPSKRHSGVASNSEAAEKIAASPMASSVAEAHPEVPEAPLPANLAPETHATAMAPPESAPARVGSEWDAMHERLIEEHKAGLAPGERMSTSTWFHLRDQAAAKLAEARSQANTKRTRRAPRLFTGIIRDLN